MLLLLQVEVGEGEEAVLECGVQGLASIHMVCNISSHILKIFLHIIFREILYHIHILYHIINIHTNLSPHNSRQGSRLTLGSKWVGEPNYLIHDIYQDSFKYFFTWSGC